ncbi:uncharacterized protein METZ01_LOCUS215906 [marine metagenome]|uniref:Uncharacterized protein n=1 Tax=marine metagenome TaxID=408172 RepID=A0A382FK99_9ZZZZ
MGNKYSKPFGLGQYILYHGSGYMGGCNHCNPKSHNRAPSTQLQFMALPLCINLFNTVSTLEIPLDGVSI